MTNNVNNNSGQLWVMLADATHARAVSRNDQGDYGTVIEMNATTTSKTAGAKTSDSFVQQIARYIGENDKKFDRLVLVAPDGILTELREALATEIPNEKIIGTLGQDLTGTSNADLRPYLIEYEQSSAA